MRVKNANGSLAQEDPVFADPEIIDLTQILPRIIFSLSYKIALSA